VEGSLRNISERKRMEEALRESEATARALLDAPHEVGLLLDPDGIILDANEVAALRLNKRKNELIGLCVWDLLEPEAANRRKAFFVRAVHSGEPIQYEHEREGKWLDCFNYPIRDSRGRVSRVAVFARDITERKLAEARLVEYQEQLRSLASELSLTEERARRRLATDLHDSISQTLAMCKLKLDELQSRASPAALANDLDHISALLARAIQDTRSLTFELSPPVLYELGIEAALESLVEKMQQVNGIPIKLSEHGGSKPLSEDTAALCFRAVQELLVNAVKHAQARNIEVSTGRERGRIRITVVDDGIGFDTSGGISRREGKGGFGLFSIRERLQNLGGSLKVDSKPGRGTRVILTAPLKDRPFKKR
jgi:PAS domain S-box-containing protein